ncbi:hypothetical protein CMK12_05760 [Candidatus Poribacteria bacterium]|jgi:hypothetical protein|nr:hypothetical protein [Candidatus Poribacteria bacterium]
MKVIRMIMYRTGKVNGYRILKGELVQWLTLLMKLAVEGVELPIIVEQTASRQLLQESVASMPVETRQQTSKARSLRRSREVISLSLWPLPRLV